MAVPTESSIVPVKRALISVSDKRGIAELAAQLHRLGVEILSTGGTAKHIEQQGIPVTQVSDHTGFPEVMGGRLKTLHPKIYGGLLARSGIDDAALKTHDIDRIDLVVVNLYPFAQVTAQSDCPLPTAIENIDIGGPAMLRAAAKNFSRVGVIVDPEDYANVITELTTSASLSAAFRLHLAQKAFAHTAEYDAAIAHYFMQQRPQTAPDFPEQLTLQLQKVHTLRYGENPHQHAAAYLDKTHHQGGILICQQHQGKQLSFNNIVDSDAALACVQEFTHPTCVIVKHATPCGIACAENVTEAYQLAYRTDPSSSFGGIIAFNRTLSAATVQAILEKQFVEVIIAPEFEPPALTILRTKPSIRVLATGPQSPTTTLDYKRVTGGFLVQENDQKTIDTSQWQVVSQRQPSAIELANLTFAWQAVKHVKSNAIVYAKEMATLGIGGGQTSRIDSAQHAAQRAQTLGLSLNNSSMASDAFLPFPDVAEIAAKYGVTAIIQPGGSIRDKAVIAAANTANLAMIFTQVRHFKH